MIGLTIFFAFFIRNTNDDKEVTGYLDDDLGLENDEEYLHSIEVSLFFEFYFENKYFSRKIFSSLIDLEFVSIV